MCATKLCFIKALSGYRLLLKHTDPTTYPSAKADVTLSPRVALKMRRYVSHIQPWSLICLIICR